jgi:small redox-active disulfide protein 2
MINIEVFGPGCARCAATKDAVRRAMETVGANATLSHISDAKEMAKNRIFFTPAVRINGETMSTGRVPKVEEIAEWLRGKATV